MQVLSDVIGMPIRVIKSTQACALGSAISAAIAYGAYATIDTAQKAMGSEVLYEYVPDKNNTLIY